MKSAKKIEQLVKKMRFSPDEIMEHERIMIINGKMDPKDRTRI